MSEEQLLNLFSDGVPSYKHGNDAVKARARSKTSEVLAIIKARDDRIVAELEKQKDTHSHMTRNYCHDCAKRDGYNAALKQAIKVIRNTN